MHALKICIGTDIKVKTPEEIIIKLTFWWEGYFLNVCTIYWFSRRKKMR
jgi:hypothetical protein